MFSRVADAALPEFAPDAGLEEVVLPDEVLASVVIEGRENIPAPEAASVVSSTAQRSPLVETTLDLENPHATVMLHPSYPHCLIIPLISMFKINK